MGNFTVRKRCTHSIAALGTPQRLWDIPAPRHQSKAAGNPAAAAAAACLPPVSRPADPTSTCHAACAQPHGWLPGKARI